jgi:hypothetical protein
MAHFQVTEGDITVVWRMAVRMLCNQQRRANSEWFFILSGVGIVENYSWYNTHHVLECYVVRSWEQELISSTEHIIVV